MIDTIGETLVMLLGAWIGLNVAGIIAIQIWFWTLGI